MLQTLFLILVALVVVFIAALFIGKYTGKNMSSLGKANQVLRDKKESSKNKILELVEQAAKERDILIEIFMKPII